MKMITLKFTPQYLSKNLFLLGFLLLFMGMIGSLSTDMYVPSLPIIAKTFKASDNAVQYTLASYLVAFGICQLFYGTLVDCFGRSKILIFALALGAFGTMLCVVSADIISFIIGRIFQGAGFAAISVSAMAMARDLLDDKKFTQLGSILSLGFGLGPLVSPVIGSYIDEYFGWTMVFIIQFVYAVLILLTLVFFIPETQKLEDRQVFHIKPIISLYMKIIQNKVFLQNALCKSIAFTGFMVFYTVTPFMLQNNLHLSTTQYGWLTLGITFTILLGKFLNTLVLKYFQIEKVIWVFSLVLLFACFLLFIFALFKSYSILAIMLPFSIFGFASGFLFANTTIVAFKPFKSIGSGSVSGLLNGSQMLAGFIGTMIAAHLALATLMPLAIFMLIMGVLAVGQYFLLDYMRD